MGVRGPHNVTKTWIGVCVCACVCVSDRFVRVGGVMRGVEGLAAGKMQGKLELLYITSKCYGINADNIKNAEYQVCVMRDS